MGGTLKKRLKTAAAVAGVCGIILVVLFLYLLGVACPSSTVIVINNSGQDAKLVKLEGGVKNWQGKLPDGRARQVTFAPNEYYLRITITLEDGRRIEYPAEYLGPAYEPSAAVFVIKDDRIEEGYFEYGILYGFDAGSFPDRVLNGLEHIFRAISCAVRTDLLTSVNVPRLRMVRMQ